MGHTVGKDVYRRLGDKLDGLSMRVPWSDTLRSLLEELYSEEDAALVAGMPWGFSTLGRLARVSGRDRDELRRRLDHLADRGLVLDLFIGGKYRYMPSPMVIGVFEFTMMRTGGQLDFPTWARLFHDYMEEGPFVEANFGDGQRVSILRALPHDDTVHPAEYVEVLDYEKAAAIIEDTDRFAIGLCSCRHEKEHLGEKPCRTPLDTCSSLGPHTVEFMTRHGLAREVSKTEMLENVARSRELGLVLNADNVQRNVSFICHCCGCCCNVLRGINVHGYTNAVVTSSYVAESDPDLCTGCGVCSRRCPVDAIDRVDDPDPRYRKFGRPVVDVDACLGCGVCAAQCAFDAMKLHRREQRVLHPVDTFERHVLACLERGTLQNALFDDPSSTTQAVARVALGAFLRLTPVKRALMSDALRSRFLDAMRAGAGRQGKGDLTAV